jgi:hypothetical protein
MQLSPSFSELSRASVGLGVNGNGSRCGLYPGDYWCHVRYNVSVLGVEGIYMCW